MTLDTNHTYDLLFPTIPYGFFPPWNSGTLSEGYEPDPELPEGITEPCDYNYVTILGAITRACAGLYTQKENGNGDQNYDLDSAYNAILQLQWKIVQPFEASEDELEIYQIIADRINQMRIRLLGTNFQRVKNEFKLLEKVYCIVAEAYYLFGNTDKAYRILSLVDNDIRKRTLLPKLTAQIQFKRQLQ